MKWDTFSNYVRHSWRSWGKIRTEWHVFFPLFHAGSHAFIDTFFLFLGGLAGSGKNRSRTGEYTRNDVLFQSANSPDISYSVKRNLRASPTDYSSLLCLNSFFLRRIFCYRCCVSVLFWRVCLAFFSLPFSVKLFPSSFSSSLALETLPTIIVSSHSPHPPDPLPTAFSVPRNSFVICFTGPQQSSAIRFYQSSQERRRRMKARQIDRSKRHRERAKETAREDSRTLRLARVPQRAHNEKSRPSQAPGGRRREPTKQSASSSRVLLYFVFAYREDVIRQINPVRCRRREALPTARKKRMGHCRRRWGRPRLENPWQRCSLGHDASIPELVFHSFPIPDILYSRLRIVPCISHSFISSHPCVWYIFLLCDLRNDNN